MIDAVEARRKDRVATVHRQARPTLAAALLFLISAPVAAALRPDTGAWLPLHLLLVGALVSAISGATQMLAVTWSTSPAPPGGPVALQRAAVVVGTILLVTGREVDNDALAATGGALVAVGVVVLAGLLLTIRRTAQVHRFLPAIDGYLVALACGLVGMAMGVHLATGGGSPELRDAHLAVNLFGLVGGVILATLPFFAATQVRAKMSPRATPTRVRALIATSAVVVAATAVALAAGQRSIAAALLAVEAVVVLSVLALFPTVGRRQLDWGGARVVQLLAGIGWWAVALVALAVAVVTDGDDTPALRALAVGGYAQILVASLAYLGPVLRGGGHEHLSEGFATTRSWIGVAGANVAAVGALTSVGALFAVGLAVWMLDTAIRGVRLLATWRRRT